MLTNRIKNAESIKADYSTTSEFGQNYYRFNNWIFIAMIISIFLFSSFIANQDQKVAGQNMSLTMIDNTTNNRDKPSLSDADLEIKYVASGLDFPTSMAFLDANDILVIEKNNGTVRRIINETLIPNPLLDVNVANRGERGMLGITVALHQNQSSYIFLYFTESSTKDGQDNEGIPPLGNRLYRYEFTSNYTLVDPQILLDLPAIPGPAHNGGKIVIGPDDNVYIAVGDMDTDKFTISQNIKNGSDMEGTGGILRVTQEGKTLGNILGDSFPLNLYYAYGIRNSFGIGFDLITGSLWDTENGPYYGDEINIVKPGFNSGWKALQGIWKDNHGRLGPIASAHPPELVDFGGKGKYSEPEFIWKRPVGPNTPVFFNSDKWGKEYKDDLFVGDFHNGNIYHFKLNNERNSLDLAGQLFDKVADSKEELKDVLFGQGFGAITDMQLSPDGNLYILSIREGGADCNVMKKVTDPCVTYNSKIEGAIFKITSKNTEND